MLNNDNYSLDEALNIINCNKMKSNSLKNFFLRNINNEECVSQILCYLGELECDLDMLNNIISNFKICYCNLIQDTSTKENNLNKEMNKLKDALNKLNNDILNLKNENKNIKKIENGNTKIFDEKMKKNNLEKYVNDNDNNNYKLNKTYNGIDNYKNCSDYNSCNTVHTSNSNLCIPINGCNNKGRLTYSRSSNENDNYYCDFPNNYCNIDIKNSFNKNLNNKMNNKKNNNIINKNNNNFNDNNINNNNININDNNVNNSMNNINDNINKINNNNNFNKGKKNFIKNNNYINKKINNDINKYLRDKMNYNNIINSNNNNNNNNIDLYNNLNNNLFNDNNFNNNIGNQLNYNNDFNNNNYMGNNNFIEKENNNLLDKIYPTERMNFSSNDINKKSAIMNSKRIIPKYHFQNKSFSKRIAEIPREKDNKISRINNILSFISNDENKLNELKSIFGNNIEAQLLNGDINYEYLEKIENILYNTGRNESIIPLSKRFQIQTRAKSNSVRKSKNNLNNNRFIRQKLRDTKFNNSNIPNIKRWKTSKDFYINKRK